MKRITTHKILNDQNLEYFLRFSLFAIYFWFGLLKILGFSPATQMVHELFDETLWFLNFKYFYVFFSCLEVLIGVLFLIPRATKMAVSVFFIHMMTTALPLFLLPQESWQYLMVPTLPGQYIIKNLALIGCALAVLEITQRKNRHERQEK